MDEPKKSPPSEDSSVSREPESGLFLSQQPLPPRRSDAIWLGPEGLRTGWRLLLYLVMRQVLYLLLGLLVYYVAESGLLALWTDLIAELAFLAAALIPALAMARMEERPFDDYGLPRRQAFGKLFWTGAVWGLAAVSVLLWTLHIAGGFDFGRLALHGVRILKFAAFWGVFFLAVGVAEEFYLRGYTQFTLTQAIGFWPSALILSIVFGAIHFHNPGETPAGLLATGCIGLFFCFTLRRTGSLWFGVGFHAAWDWGESFLYSVPDSGTVSPGHLLKSSLHGPAWLTGGSAGPEGSVLLFVILIMLAIAFDRVYREVKYPIPQKLEIRSAG